jgi:phenylacetate-CoA ligase
VSNEYPNLARRLRNVPQLQQDLKTMPEAHWKARGNKMALQLFREMAERVPAYKDFLAKRKFDPASVRTINDFKHIPPVDKDNYLRQYPRKMLCWDGELATKQWVISTTSGSTGEPFYFPRTGLQDDFYALTAELYLRENFRIQDKTTL